MARRSAGSRNQTPQRGAKLHQNRCATPPAEAAGARAGMTGCAGQAWSKEIPTLELVPLHLRPRRVLLGALGHRRP